jgi:hypothetical protein
MPENANHIINGLWIGNQLSILENLTIRSFLNKGHQFNLWVYDKSVAPLPSGVSIRDANEIIPFEEVFTYRFKNQFGHGQGSYAGFSDIFRYKLLYQYGGWWVDMDVTCLKPFDFEAPYVFRTHHDLRIVGNIMKCPPGSELMKVCYEKAVSQVSEVNRDWNLPIKILNETVEALDLGKYILELSNQDSWLVIRKMIRRNAEIPGHWYAIHWVNEEWRRNKVDKNYCGEHSTLRKLFIQNNLEVIKLPWRKRCIIFWRLTIIFYLFSSLSRIRYFHVYIWKRYGSYVWWYVDRHIKKPPRHS